ncbi:MAG TPA: Ig-like domain-containing protein [Kofleriaceae bacterium]|nr:Ig-like domain-containing protein [Kofleriaceae bacterium]
MTRSIAALLVALGFVVIGVVIGPGLASAGPAGSTGYVAAPTSAFVPTPHGGLVSDIIYINRCTGCPGPTCGCVFTKSSISDATSNQTIIGGVEAGVQMTVTEFSHSQAVWDELMTCIRSVYSPYDVVITDVDPGQTPHHEAVVAGRGRDMMLTGVGGIAPLDSGTCEPQNNVISFSFANQYSGGAGLTTAEQICWTVAQESAHAFGLDHALDCSDPLTYLYTLPNGGSCGIRYFRNKLIDCGENVARPCVCGGNKQNSHAKLLAVHGMGTVPPPPTVEVTMPADGATVGASFSVVANVIEPRGVNRVELLVNGHEWTQVEGAVGRTAYLIPVPADVPDGILEIDVRGCNDLDACATDRTTVTKGAPCTTADTCAAGQRCDAGRCLWDPPVGAIGDACTYPEFCTSGVCADIGAGELACTENCFGGPNDQCPDEYVCSAGTGQMGVCAPPPVVDGCCLSDAGRSNGRRTLAVNLGLGGLVGLLVIRRRRRRAAAA